MQRIYIGFLICAPFALVSILLLWVFGFFNSRPALPVFPGAQQVSSDYSNEDGDFFRPNIHVRYVTDAEPSAVQMFYADSMTKDGWSHFTDECGTDEYRIGMGTHSFQFLFRISRAPEANETTVDVYLHGPILRFSCDIQN